jgi:hypothetical protein
VASEAIGRGFESLRARQIFKLLKSKSSGSLAFSIYPLPSPDTLTSQLWAKWHPKYCGKVVLNLLDYLKDKAFAFFGH